MIVVLNEGNEDRVLWEGEISRAIYEDVVGEHLSPEAPGLNPVSSGINKPSCHVPSRNQATLYDKILL